MNKLRLLIAGEEVSALQGLATIFVSEGNFEVLETLSLSLTVKKALLLQPDAILVDTPKEIANFGGIIRDIKVSCPCCRVLLLISQEHTENIIPLLEQGLDGCIPQGIRRSDLIKAVELACQAGVVCLPNFIKNSIYSLKSPAAFLGEMTKSNLIQSSNSLTKRETEILQLMAKNLSNREICEHLFICEPTVKTHVSHILRKLGQTNRAQAIIYSYKTGLIG